MNIRNDIIREKERIWSKEHREKYPWKYTLKRIRTRCNNPNSKDYPKYGGRDIKCEITSEDLEFLWLRDNASKMKKPTIDRMNNDKNYTIDNCQYIENYINAGKDKYIKINQYNLKGIFIKSWNSQEEIVKVLNIPQPCISEAINGKQKTSGGFIWKKY